MNSLRTLVRTAALLLVCSLSLSARALSLTGPLPAGLTPPPAQTPSLFAFHALAPAPPAVLEESSRLSLLSQVPSLNSLPAPRTETTQPRVMTPPLPAAALSAGNTTTDDAATFSLGNVSTVTSATVSKVFALGDIWSPEAELSRSNVPLPFLAIGVAALLLGLQVMWRHHRKW